MIYVGRGLLKSWSGTFFINFKLRLVYRVAGAIGRTSVLQPSGLVIHEIRLHFHQNLLGTVLQFSRRIYGVPVLRDLDACS